MSLSISIVTHNSDQTALTDSIRGLEKSIEYAIQNGLVSHVELFFIDNASTNLPEPPESNSNTSVSFTRNNVNLGFGKAHNLAILKANTDWHLVLNPDAILEKEYLAHGIQYLRNHDDVVMVAPSGLDSDGRDARLCKRYPSILALAIRALLPGWKPRPVSDYEYKEQPQDAAYEVELASGCCMLARTSALKAIAGFSPKFFLYFEDFDLSLRIRKFGSILCLPELRLQHLGGNTSRKGLRHILLFSTSGWKFFNRHGWKWF